MARLGKFFYINGTDNLSNAHFLRVRADGGITESLGCIDTAGTLLESASYFMRPSGYKEDTVYSLIPNNSNGSLNFVRGSDAWRTEIGGLVQRTPYNLARYSEDFSNAVWVSDGTTTVTTNATNDPNGNLTADRLQMSNSQRRYIYQNISVTASTLTYSIYLRASSNQSVRIGTDQSCSFYRGALICNVTTEWQRFTLTVTGVTAGNLAIVIDNITSNITQCTGTASTIDLFAWGAQLVEGVDQLPYFPTTDRLNVPRLDYTYGTCPALLLEPQRTNLAQNSGFVGTGSAPTNWTQPGGTGTSSLTSSTLGVGVQACSQSATAQRPFLQQDFAVSANTTYTFSIYVESISGTINYNNILFITNPPSGATTSYFLDGVAINEVSQATTGRLSIRLVVGATTGTISMRCGLGVSSSATASILFSRPQLEVGAYTTTFILTGVGATATRIADSFSRNNIYTNGLITSSGGTWFVELRGNISYVRDASSRLGIGNDSTLINDSIFLNPVFGGGRIYIQKCIGTVVTGLYQTINDIVKIAIKWNGTTADVFVNGTKVVSATAFTTTNMDWLTSGAGTPIYIQQMALFNYPLSDANCQLLTT